MQNYVFQTHAKARNLWEYTHNHHGKPSCKL